jgi:serine/threonine protein kinase
MFLKEAHVAALIHHPNVVQILDLGRDGDGLFMALEYVDGCDLGDVLRQLRETGEKMPIGIAARITAEVAAGLHAAHTLVGEDGQPHPVVHRDISPGNVLLDWNGAVRVTDFGVAKAQGGEATAPGTLKGRLSYMSPEEIGSGGIDVTPQSDIFSAGAMLYQLLTGRHPFRRKKQVETLEAILFADCIPAGELRSMPEALAEVVQRALAPDRSVRFATAQELRQALERVLLSLEALVTTEHVAEWLRRTMKPDEK